MKTAPELYTKHISPIVATNGHALKMSNQHGNGDGHGPSHLTSESLDGTVRAMSRDVDLVRGALGKIAASAQRQTGSLREIASSAQHAAREAADTMAVVTQARGQARDAEIHAGTVTAQVDELAHGVGKLAELSREGMEQVAGLVDLTGRLDEILDFVREVTERTNLLSLNASIEAARAGVHGRGFTVVAAEIRKLAESTRSATREMETLLTGIRKRALSSSEITRRTDDAVAGSRATSEAALSGLRVIGSAVEDVLGAFGRVEEAIAEHVAQGEEFERTAQEVLETSHEYYGEAAQSALAINALHYHTTSITALANPPHWTQQRPLRVATLLEPDTLPARMLARFCDGVRKRTDGRVRVEFLPSYQSRGVGQFQTLIDLRAGELAISAVTTSVFGNVMREAQALELPFLFESREHANAVLDGPVGQRLLEKAADYGLVGLGFVENGFRHLSNSVRPIATPEDVAEMRIRVVESPVYLFFAEALGMTAVAIPVDKLLAALRTKQVAGQDNPLPNFMALRLYEAQPYLTLSAHFFSTQVVLANSAIFEQLGEYRDDVVAALDEAISWHRTYAVQLDRDAISQLAGKVQVRSLSAAERERFRSAVQPVYDRVEVLIGREAVAAARSAASAARTYR